MDKLLRRWAESEPERCNAYNAVLIGDDWIEIIDQFPIDLAIVQAAVQEAIEVRGWYMTLSSLPIDGRGDGHIYEAAVHTVDEVMCFTPAEALLLAYLAALEAEAP